MQVHETHEQTWEKKTELAKRVFLVCRPLAMMLEEQ